MPFLRLHINKKIKSTVNSLRTRLKILHQMQSLKRASPFILRKLRASITVEAAFALPFFLFFMLQVMSAMNMIAAGSRLTAALHQVGNRMAFAGYAYDKAAGNVLPDGLASVALTQLYAVNQITDYAGRDYLNHSCVKNGAAGISYAGTSIMGEHDVIEICLSYQTEPLFSIPGFESFSVSQRYYGRAWTGYDVEEGMSDLTQEDPMVYITQTGTVYHTNRNCTYLNPSVRTIPAASLGDSRNESGGKYYACEICGRKNATGNVYITGQGDRYHSTASCSGLKRTIYTVPLSEVHGRGCCSKCR